MTKFFAKKLNKKGFTLAELLIVVAIIAVLVAIALPIFTGALEKARLGVHRNNARALKSMGVAAILGSPDLEAAADGIQKWLVSAKYNFKTEQYEDMKVNPVDSTGQAADGGAMFAYTSEVTADNVAKGSAFNQFGSKDDEIGKMKTTDAAYYAAVITQQEIAAAGNVKLIPDT